MTPEDAWDDELFRLLSVAGVDATSLEAASRDARAARSRGEPCSLALLLLSRQAVEPSVLDAQLSELESVAAEAKASDALPPAGQVGPYRLIRELARGGMGSVWEAEQVENGARVALKRILPRRSEEEAQVRERFRREALALARLDHPHVVRIHSAALEGPVGELYLVQEFLEGGSLLDRLQQGPLEPEAARRLLIDLAAGLAHAHAQGVLHRDLKPGNVLFHGDGRPALADFGLARLDQATRMTQTGQVLGTPVYMAPEQIVHAAGVDERADVYGLGALLYVALTARPPFQGRSLCDLLARVLHDPPRPVRARRPEVPPALAAACERALAKDPAQRPPTAEAFAAVLRALDPTATPPAPPRRIPGWALGLGAGLVSTLALGLALVGLPEPEAEPKQEARAPARPPGDPRAAATPVPRRWLQDAIARRDAGALARLSGPGSRAWVDRLLALEEDRARAETLVADSPAGLRFQQTPWENQVAVLEPLVQRLEGCLAEPSSGGGPLAEAVAERVQETVARVTLSLRDGAEKLPLPGLLELCLRSLRAHEQDGPSQWMLRVATVYENYEGRRATWAPAPWSLTDIDDVTYALLPATFRYRIGWLLAKAKVRAHSTPARVRRALELARRSLQVLEQEPSVDRRNPTDPGGDLLRHLARRHLTLAWLALRERRDPGTDLDEAIRLAREALRIQPTERITRMSLSVALLLARDLEGADAVIREIPAQRWRTTFEAERWLIAGDVERARTLLKELEQPGLGAIPNDALSARGFIAARDGEDPQPWWGRIDTTLGHEFPWRQPAIAQRVLDGELWWPGAAPR